MHYDFLKHDVILLIYKDFTCICCLIHSNDSFLPYSCENYKDWRLISRLRAEKHKKIETTIVCFL